jgi:hypothetical protein
MFGDMKTLALLCLIAFASPALAEEPVSPSEFWDYAEGHTLYFERDGEPFGSEAFEPGGRTTYGEATEVQCWRLIRDDKGLLVRLLGESSDAGMELRITGRDKRQPICGEPGRGA